jgi:hypothetical protein
MSETERVDEQEWRRSLFEVVQKRALQWRSKEQTNQAQKQRTRQEPSLFLSLSQVTVQILLLNSISP